MKHHKYISATTINLRGYLSAIIPENGAILDNFGKKNPQIQTIIAIIEVLR